MAKKIVTNSVIIFFVFVFMFVAILFYFFPESFSPGSNAKIGDVLRCQSAKISDNLGQANINKGRNLELLVSFKNKPTDAQLSIWEDRGVKLYPDSWIFNYLVAESGYENLCALVAADEVTYIDIVNK